ncbi:alpha/beta fold hydrolase [Polynucleobacter necessarius]|uniref:alpha/beta fold hydrolase n=1 Tax=Polynucleobacter necessarius TaxID=576610 RepID=UPI001E51520F|nr:alpha/beta fold hydrolase [Polynucleobacter necessarius]
MHGFPQTKAIWHEVAPALAAHYTVVASDLLGYGQSSKPNGKPDHSSCSKRSMAASNPAYAHAMCEDYRAAATIDLVHDRADRGAGKKLAMPLHVLWGEHGLVHKCFKPVEDWQKVVNQVTGKSVPCGHYIPEELSRTVIDEARLFFNGV